MKSLSNRSWVILLGIAVAMMIATAAFFFNGAPGTVFSGKQSVQKPSTTTASSVTIRKILEVIDLKIFLPR